MNTNKVLSVLNESASLDDAKSAISDIMQEEELKELEEAVGFVDDAINNLERALTDNKADLAGWIQAKESGNGVQPRMIDLRSKPVVIAAIDVQLNGMKDLKAEIESEIEAINSSKH